MILNQVNLFDVESYNYWIEISSFIFLGVLLIRFFLTRKFKTSINTLFGLSIICGMLDMALDIAGSVLIDKYQNVPILANTLINGAFYIFQIAFPFLLFTYIVFSAGVTYKNNRWLWLATVPAIFFNVLLVINYFNGIIFSFDYNAVDGVFKHGPLFSIYYIDLAFYFVLIICALLVLRKRIEKDHIIAISISIAITIGLIICQMFVSEILLTGLAIALSCWILYEKMANPLEMIDKVTGVFNFNALSTFLENEIKRGKRNYHYIVLNIESITPINKSFGIRTGNETYKQIGSYFNSLSKNNVWLFRVFNSRFIFACKEESKQIDIVANIKLRFQNSWIVDNNKFELKCQLYYFSDSKIIKTTEEFIDFCNSLDSQVKKEVNGRYIHIEEEYLDSLSRKQKIETALSESIKNGFEGFEVYYQPIYEVETGKFRFAEALLRFKNDELGYVSPGEFIPVAESSGLAKKIDEHVLITVCNFLKEHQEIPGISVNISYIEFFNNPTKKFCNIVEASEIDPKRICFEVTETATVEYSDKIDVFMNEMKERGFSFAIDDFGTGYSNMARVVSKSFGYVKLDRIFLDVSDKMEIILRNIIDLFKQLNIPILIEGVETEEQLKKVIDLGVDHVQGYYFSRPVPKQQYLEFLEKHK